MTTYTNSRGVALERAYQHWRERGALLKLPFPKHPEPPLTVAISRELGAGGSEISQAIAERMGWPLYDRELVSQISDDTGIRSQLLEKLDEKNPSWLAECLEGFSEERNISGAGYAIRLRKILLALYYHGDCVILGRGAAQILPPEKTLRVRLVAPLGTRIERMSKILGSQDDAVHMVTESDRDREAFVKRYFFKDPASSECYDLTLDTSRFSQEACVDIIATAIEGHLARQSAAS